MKSMVNLKHKRFKDLGKGECKMENMVNVVNGVNFVEESKEEKAMMNEEVKAQKNVVANEEEKEMMNEEVKQENNHEGMVRRFCVECGKELWLPKGSRQTICNECKAEKKAMAAKVAHERAMERKAKLGLVTKSLSIYESTFNILRNGSKEKGISIAEYLRILVEGKQKAEQETEQEEIA